MELSRLVKIGLLPCDADAPQTQGRESVNEVQSPAERHCCTTKKCLEAEPVGAAWSHDV